MALYVLTKGTDVLRGPGAYDRRGLAAALQAEGLQVSLGASPPAEALTIADGPPAIRILVLPDRPSHDPELETCAWDRQAGEWVVTCRPVAAMRAVLIQRSRDLCRAGIAAGASDEDQRNAALEILTPQEIAAIKACIGDWRDAHATHKAAIEALEDAADLAVYDLSAGWPEDV